MSRLLTLTLAACALAASVGAGSSYAHRGGPATPVTRAANELQLRTWLATAEGTAGGTESAAVKTGIARMQMAAGRLVPLRSVSTITVVATGSLVVWRIADSAGLGGYIYKKITGQDIAGSYTGLGTVMWTWSPAGSDGNCNAVFGAGIGCFRFNDSTGRQVYCAPYNSSGCFILAAWSNLAGAAAGLTTDSGGCGTIPVNNACKVKVKNELAMRQAVRIEPATAAEYSAATNQVSAGTNTVGTPSSAQLLTALDELGARDSTDRSATDPVAEATIDYLNTRLDPSYEVGTITLPQPIPNETYTAYTTRLQDLGWLGTATTTVLSPELDGYGPDAVARIISTEAGTTRVLDPLRWPTTAPKLGLNTNVTLRYNPSTAPQAPTQTGGGTSVVLPPTTVPGVPAVDFSPITGLDPGCSFPFGLICWAETVTGWFSVTPDAPVFSFDLSGFSTPIGTVSLGTYSVDLNVMDAYMVMMRQLITVALWVGGVFWLARNLLGFGAGGDPAEAADEALHV